MSTTEADVAAHYGRSDLVAELRTAIQSAGFDLADLDVDALAGVDEFHFGGRVATEALVEMLDVDADSRILEVGCGIGGAARVIANRIGCTVSGIDLTPEFVAAATELSELVGLADLTTFEVGSALDLPFEDEWFHAVTMIHVGMNIADKVVLIAELRRVLRPGGSLVIYDIMRTADGDIDYPLPWASEEATSFVSRSDEYANAITAAGLIVTSSSDWRDMVLQVIAKAQDTSPPVNLQLMGADWSTMFENVLKALHGGIVSPIHMVGRCPTMTPRQR